MQTSRLNVTSELARQIRQLYRHTGKGSNPIIPAAYRLFRTTSSDSTWRITLPSAFLGSSSRMPMPRGTL